MKPEPENVNANNATEQLHLGSRFTSAVDYARHIHIERRKGNEIPYMAHLLGVSSCLKIALKVRDQFEQEMSFILATAFLTQTDMTEGVMVFLPYKEAEFFIPLDNPRCHKDEDYYLESDSDSFFAAALKLGRVWRVGSHAGAVYNPDGSVTY